MSRFVHSCKNFSQAHENSQKLPGWRIFAFTAIFVLSLICKICANCEKSQGGRFFTKLGIFAFFFIVMLKTNSKSSCGFYQICAAEIAKNRQPNDFSRYLRFLPFFFMLMIIKSKASCRPFFVVIGV